MRQGHFWKVAKIRIPGGKPEINQRPKPATEGEFLVCPPQMSPTNVRPNIALMDKDYRLKVR